VKRILVVAYSRTGTTRRVAEAVAAQCDADLEWIRDRDNREGLRGYLRSAAQSLAHRCPWIQPPRCPPGDYALVIIGTPVWAGNIASPVRSYLTRHGRRCRRVAFFCTHGGTGAGKVLQDLHKLCGKRPLATLALPRQQVAHDHWSGPVAQFTRRFNGQRGATVPGDIPSA
jgi:flavodoxin